MTERGYITTIIILYLFGMVLMDYVLVFYSNYAKKRAKRWLNVASIIAWPVAVLIFVMPDIVDRYVIRSLRKTQEFLGRFTND